MRLENIIATCVYSIPPILAGLFFMVWLFRIWHRTRKAVYVWLLAGMGLFPVCYAAAMAFNWIHADPTPPYNFLLAVTMSMLTCMEIGCVVMALGNMEEGAVGFRDLFMARVKPGKDSDMASIPNPDGE